MSDRILIADDEQGLREAICDFLTRAGYEVDAVADGTEALERIQEGDYAVLLSDLRMPGLDGIALLRQVVATRPETSVLIMTAYAAVDSAVEALRLGAYDYLLKPVVPEELRQKLDNLLAYRSLKQEVSRLRRDVQHRAGLGGIVGSSAAIRHVFDQIELVAPTPSTVLVTGESGTGKELVAGVIHERSNVADREFIAVNVAAMPAGTVESQLFGHEKGSFTGATQRHEGILRAVHGGTVFLDEVGELSLEAQAKLLRAIDVKEVFPVGGVRPFRVDFRLVAATNRRLEQAVAAGTFREDLFFRLNVFRIELPPLRERREDIPALVQHFVRLHELAVGRRGQGVSNEAMRLLLGYTWPGNVRELSNAIERAVILAGQGAIEPEHLPMDFRGLNALPISLREALDEAERRHIAWVLQSSEGNREEAARRLQIDRATLYRKLDKYGIH